MPSASTEPPRPTAPDGDEGWLRIEVDRAALRHNAALFRALARPPARLLAVVKADGYGHGIVIAARAFLEGGADLLGVHAVAEAQVLRDAGLRAPILILGPLPGPGVARARRLGCEITVGSLAGLDAAVAAAGLPGSDPLPVHLKVETGVNRQGIVEGELDAALARAGRRAGPAAERAEQPLRRHRGHHRPRLRQRADGALRGVAGGARGARTRRSGAPHVVQRGGHPVARVAPGAGAGRGVGVRDLAVAGEPGVGARSPAAANWRCGPR